MDLLIQLGVNHTLAFQLVAFLIVFATLKLFLFEPYYTAYKERQDRTLGKTELAERFVAEARELEERYAVRAQEANDRFREVFDKARLEAVKEHDRVVSEARAKNKAAIDDINQRIHKEMVAVRTQLSNETSGVAQLIVQKLVGKDLTP
jgi:F0F1-type ATP synthase membrane subunit b/b'